MYQRYLKRPLDFVGALVALVLLSPLLLALALLVRLKLGSPVLFKQPRPGLNERIFTINKFRTMTDARDAQGQLLPDSARLTRFGRWLRATSLDELPELWNVLKGDMSLVGPRPLLVTHVPYFRQSERFRATVRPGITGLAQVSGRNALAWDERFAADLVYANNVTFVNDVKIIVKTALVVLRKKDILVGDEHILLNLDEERGGDFVYECKK